MATSKKEIIEIKPIETVQTKIRVVGDSPLIVHAWSVKAKREMLEKQLGFKTLKKREAKNPVEDFISSMYWLTPMPEDFTAEAVSKAFTDGARFGFPVTAFKAAAIASAYRAGYTKDKVSAQGAFFIQADASGYYAGDLQIDMDKKCIDIVPNLYKPDAMAEIHADTPVMREDMVRVGMGTADIRYRAQFDNWYADLTIVYNKNGQYSLDQIINMINVGGFACGVGEWRAEKGGTYGQFHVATV